jgi:hypothetical protein
MQRAIFIFFAQCCRNDGPILIGRPMGVAKLCP